MYPVLPNTAEKDLQTSLQNYNNLLEHQIFEKEEHCEDIVADESRNLSLASANGLSRGATGF